MQFFPHEEEAWKRFDFELGVLEMRVYAGGGAGCESGEDGWGFVGEAGVGNGEFEGGFAVEDVFCFGGDMSVQEEDCDGEGVIAGLESGVVAWWGRRPGGLEVAVDLEMDFWGQVRGRMSFWWTGGRLLFRDAVETDSQVECRGMKEGNGNGEP